MLVKMLGCCGYVLTWQWRWLTLMNVLWAAGGARSVSSSALCVNAISLPVTWRGRTHGLLVLICLPWRVCVCVSVRACFLLSGEGYGGGWACFSLAQPPFRETGRKSLSGTEEPTRLMASGPIGVLKREAQAARRAASCRGPRSQALAGVSRRRLFLLWRKSNGSQMERKSKESQMEVKSPHPCAALGRRPLPQNHFLGRLFKWF